MPSTYQRRSTENSKASSIFRSVVSHQPTTLWNKQPNVLLLINVFSRKHLYHIYQKKSSDFMDFFLNEGEKPLKKLETTVFTPKFVYIFQKSTIFRQSAQIYMSIFISYARNNPAFRQYSFPARSEAAKHPFLRLPDYVPYSYRIPPRNSPVSCRRIQI